MDLEMNLVALRLLVIASATGAAALQVSAQGWDRDKIAYQSKCAVCHGMDAKGDGSLAGQVKTAPTDLTQLSKRNGGLFPEAEVNKTIDGRREVEAHGPRDMPVWSYGFSSAIGQKNAS